MLLERLRKEGTELNVEEVKIYIVAAAQHVGYDCVTLFVEHYHEKYGVAIYGRLSEKHLDRYHAYLDNARPK